MCTPDLAIAATIAGGMMTAGAAVEQGSMESDAARRNAENQERLATDAVRRGAETSYGAVKRGRDIIAQQLLAMAANNVDANSGSMADLMSKAAGAAMYDARLAENNAEREAYGYLVNAANERTNANMYKAKARNSAMNTLLTTATSVGNKLWPSFKEPVLGYNTLDGKKPVYPSS